MRGAHQGLFVAELAHRQLERDRTRTARFPGLHETKIAKMTASPLGFLRGSAPLFYEILAAEPDLSAGPDDRGWIVGDLHLENFGAFRPGLIAPGTSRGRARSRDAEREPTVFDLNDFDDAVPGPWRFDVLRLTTSLALASRELGADGRRTIELCRILLKSYSSGASGEKWRGAMPGPVARLVLRAASRTKTEMLEARTRGSGEGRRFVRGTRYRALPRALRNTVGSAFAAYSRALDPLERADDEAMEVLDAAFRVAGNGSLGSLRIAVLAYGKGGDEGAWVFDMKEEGEPAASAILGPSRLVPAERVATAARSCLARPPRMLGTARLGKTSMIVRRLTPQEDKLDLTTVRGAELDDLAAYLGTLTGAAHARGRDEGQRERRWSEIDCGLLLDRALTLAGIHEGAYLAYSKLVG